MIDRSLASGNGDAFSYKEETATSFTRFKPNGAGGYGGIVSPAAMIFAKIL